MFRRAICFVLSAVLFVSVSAEAQERDRNFSFGVGYGKSDNVFDENATSGTGTARTSSADFWAAYDFTPNFGVQFNYWFLAFDQDVPPVRVDQGGGAYIVYDDAARYVDGWSLSGTATWPVTEWLHLTGRAGVFFWHAETTASVGFFDSKTLSSDSGRSFTYGAGLLFGDPCGFRFDYDGFAKVDQSRIQTVTGGVFCRF